MAEIRLFLVGDVMLGRGVDQLQEVSCDPNLGEGSIVSARDYVNLAEERKGKIPDERGPEYVWGDALKILEEKKPDARIVNLETAITEQDTAWPKKFVRYRMHPDNVNILKAAEIDCCCLSNNHICDWGYEGMSDTMKYLKDAEVAHAGVGTDLEKAKAPGIVTIPGFGRVLVFGAAHLSSGVPRAWMAGEDKPGVHCLDFIDVEQTAKNLTEHIDKFKRKEDKVVVSIHWGDNYNWDVKETQVNFAHALLDGGSVDVIHGHSSHHLKGVEIYNKKVIIYGCGDFINDYEGIVTQHDEEFRDDLTLMYFVDVDDKTRDFISLTAVPMEIRHMQSKLAEEKDVDWLEETFTKQCDKFGVKVKRLGNEFEVNI